MPRVPTTLLHPLSKPYPVLNSHCLLLALSVVLSSATAVAVLQLLSLLLLLSLSAAVFIPDASIAVIALSEACCASGLTYIVQDTASCDILSKSLALPYDQYKALELDDHPAFRPVLSVFDALDKLPEHHEQSAALNFIWATHGDHMNKGYAKRVVQATMQAAQQAGYVSLIADFTNVVSQRLGESFGYQPHVKVRYHDFEPFKGITCTDHAIRSVKQLAAAADDQKQQQDQQKGVQ
jgi:hypothetical protein